MTKLDTKPLAFYCVFGGDCTMKRKLVWLVALVLVLAVSLSAVAAKTPMESPALEVFVNQLSCCFRIEEAKPLDDCTVPGGWYAMYYADDPNSRQLKHDFGWYSEDFPCGALNRIVSYRAWDGYKCQFVSYNQPHHILPCDVALSVNLAPGRNIGFYLNAPRDNEPELGGHYFTCTNHNWDGIQHAFLIRAFYSFNEGCKATCCEIPPEGEMYLIFWEDSCKGGDMDWNDFSVALIPCKR
jgi:hypothetical protein